MIVIVQAAPVMFDKNKCIEKTVDLIHEAAKQFAELIYYTG